MYATYNLVSITNSHPVSLPVQCYLVSLSLYASCSPLATSIIQSLESLGDTVSSHFEECHHAYGVNEIMEVLRKTNEFVQEERPWELRKGDSDRGGSISSLWGIMNHFQNRELVCGESIPQ